MPDKGEPANDQARVAHLLEKHKEQKDLTEQAECAIMQALWDLRGSYSIEDMARWTSWSRQTIYNKWAKHGIKVSDA